MGFCDNTDEDYLLFNLSVNLIFSNIIVSYSILTSLQFMDPGKQEHEMHDSLFIVDIFLSLSTNEPIT